MTGMQLNGNGNGIGIEESWRENDCYLRVSAVVCDSEAKFKVL